MQPTARSSDANGPGGRSVDRLLPHGTQSFWSGSVDGSRRESRRRRTRAARSSLRRRCTPTSPAARSRRPATAVEIANARDRRGDARRPAPTATRDNLHQLDPRRRHRRCNDVADAVDDPRLVMGDPLHARPVTVIYGGTAAAPGHGAVRVHQRRLPARDRSRRWHRAVGLHPRPDAAPDDRAVPRQAPGCEALRSRREHPRAEDRRQRQRHRRTAPTACCCSSAWDVAARATTPWTSRTRTRRGCCGARARRPRFVGDGTPLPAADQLSNLGQTWSTPVPTQVKIGADTKRVVIVAGGYDPSQDNVGYHTDDTSATASTCSMR